MQRHQGPPPDSERKKNGSCNQVNPSDKLADHTIRTCVERSLVFIRREKIRAVAGRMID